MNEEKEQKASLWLRKAIIVFVIISVLYLISFGPFVALTENVHNWTGLIGLLSDLYIPHMALCYHSKLYYRYVHYWARLGGRKYGPHHDVYRKWWESLE